MAIMDVNSWEPISITERIKNLKEHGNDALIRSRFLNEAILSPLDLYCYLKARFGSPNGNSMLHKKPKDSDNLIQWHFTITSDDEKLDILGFTSRIEFIAARKKEFTRENWIALLTTIKMDFKTFGSEMSRIRKKLQQWTLFINPYHRLRVVVTAHVKALQELAIDDLKPIGIISNTFDLDEVNKKIDFYISSHQKALSITSMLRMAAPVLAEAFINLLIFITVKQKIRNDDRMYKDLIEKQIDIRVKSLPLFCHGFIKDPDENDKEFKNFRNLMNHRNLILHGNIDPQKLAFDQVWFDEFTPLFKEEKIFLERATEHSLKHIEPKEALNDIKIVDDFIAYLMGLLTPEVQNSICLLKDDATPGWLESDKRPGQLFPKHCMDIIMPTNNMLK